MSHHFAKPVNALRKANDLVKVDKDDAALRILHSMLLSRRYRTWQSTHEEIMMLYVSLAVKNRKNAKEGLLQYRMICQTANIESLEAVIQKFCSLAEERAAQAQREADAEEDTATPAADALLAAEQLSEEVDEDIGYRPAVQRFFVGGVGGEDAQDRSKRRLVTPWLKYLWDTYRTVLDVMRNNAKLDALYHATVVKALAYCTKHQRTSEFRRLCEIMRIHMNAIHSHQGQTNSVDIRDAATIQAYLRSRFLQLEAASTLDLWQESYRIIEDIHELLQISQTALDAKLLATYYTRLETVFWNSDNALFHAYSLEKLYTFAASASAADAELQSLADRLAIAALVIPARVCSAQSSTSSASDKTLEYLDATDQKNLRLSAMLGFSEPPSRARLMHRLGGGDVLQRCSDQVRAVFALAGTKIAPRTLRTRLTPLLDAISAREDLRQYVGKLVDVFVVALLQQLGKVYRVVMMSAFVEMLPPASAASGAHLERLERVIVRSGRDRQVRVRVDHCRGKLVFDEDVAAAPGVRGLVSRLANRLSAAAADVQQLHLRVQRDQQQQQREQVFRLVRAGMEREHRDVFVRRAVIERRKQAAEMAVQRDEAEARSRRAAQQLRAAEDERRRLAEDRERRERERIERVERERRREANREAVEKLKEAAQGERASVRSLRILERLETRLDELDDAKLQEAQNEVAAEEQRVRERKAREEAKRIDYFTRAARLEERGLLEQDFERQRRDDKAYYEAQWRAHLAQHRAQHSVCVAEKARLARLAPTKLVFVAQIMKRRRAAFEAQQEAQKARREAREAEEAAKRAAEQERLEAEERERERREKEAEEAAKRAREDAERRAKLEEERRAAAAEQDRIAEIQRQRQLEMEEKRRAAAAGLEPTIKPALVASKADSMPWRRVQTATTTTTTTTKEASWAARSGASQPDSERSWRSRPAPDARSAAASAAAASGDSTKLRPTERRPLNLQPRSKPPPSAADRDVRAVRDRAADQNRAGNRDPEVRSGFERRFDRDREVRGGFDRGFDRDREVRTGFDRDVRGDRDRAADHNRSGDRDREARGGFDRGFNRDREVRGGFNRDRDVRGDRDRRGRGAANTDADGFTAVGRGGRRP